MADADNMEDENSVLDDRDAGTQKLETPSGYIRLIRERNLRNFCHSTKVQTSEGDIEKIKMRTTAEFLDLFNKIVVGLAEAAINNAVENGRTTLMKEDIELLHDFIEDSLGS